MPRPLTALAVANAKPDPARRIEIADGATPGLRLVIQPTGSKSWAFRYERTGRKPVKLTLGTAAGPGAMSLADARQRASEARRGMADGIDPAEARRAERAASEARRLAEEAAVEAALRQNEDRVDVWLDRYVSRRVDGRLKSAHEVKRLFDKEVRPQWGKLPVASITRKDVIRLIEDIAERGAGTTANRTLANVRAWLGWCVQQDIIAASPAERVDPPKDEKARDRVLLDEELRFLALAIDKLEWPWRQFFTIALLTGQRREEVAGMRWDELELGGPEPVWVLPPHRTKNGREHAVPLVKNVVEALQTTNRLAGSPFVLTTTGKTSISGFSKAKLALDAAMTAVIDEADTAGAGATAIQRPGWRLHDLRRTAASGMARHGISVAVVEKVLNHVSGTFGGIVGVYQRHDFAAEKRHALTVWADHIENLKRRPLDPRRGGPTDGTPMDD